jgi:hypothetical protein
LIRYSTSMMTRNVTSTPISMYFPCSYENHPL